MYLACWRFRATIEDFYYASHRLRHSRLQKDLFGGGQNRETRDACATM